MAKDKESRRDEVTDDQLEDVSGGATAPVGSAGEMGIPTSSIPLTPTSPSIVPTPFPNSSVDGSGGGGSEDSDGSMDASDLLPPSGSSK